MADRRIKDQTTTRTAPLADDYIAVDGTTGGSARMLLEPLLESDDRITFTFENSGSVITTGIKINKLVPFDCDITGWTLLADQSGSIVIDIWKLAYASYPPLVANTITGSEKPTLSSALINQDLALTTWTTALNKGDVLRPNIDSVSTVLWVELTLYVKRRVT